MEILNYFFSVIYIYSETYNITKRKNKKLFMHVKHRKKEKKGRKERKKEVT